MSSKPVAWGEVIKRRQQSKLEKSLADTAVKEEENKSSDSPDEKEVVAQAVEETSNENSLFSAPDFMFTGNGNTVVCQVLSNV